MSHAAEGLTEPEETCNQHPLLKFPKPFHAPSPSPGCLQAVLHSFAHYVTAENPICPAGWGYLPLWEHADHHGWSRTSKYHTSRSHKTPSPEAVSRIPSHTHTHQPCQTAPLFLTFSKLRTHSRTFLRMSVSISHSRAVRWSKAASKRIILQSERFRWERCCSGQLRHRTTDWLRSGWCRPSHRLSEGLPPLSHALKQPTLPIDISPKLTCQFKRTFWI